ncbi:MAG: M48 family metalloprotease, partial [Pseudomonadota bacterium]
MNSPGSRFVLIATLMLLSGFLRADVKEREAALEGKAKKIHAQIVASTPLYDNKEVAEYVERIGDSLVEKSSHAGREYSFFVLDDQGVNAFTPGYGLIYMHRGLLTMMTNEAELAGVLAHEIGHNIGNHLARRKTAITLGNIGAYAASLLTGSSSVGNSVGIVNQERLAAASREMELEADRIGAEIMYADNYDPSQLLGVLGILKDHSNFMSTYGGQGVSYHGVFSSHPRSDKRLQEVVKQAGELPPGEGFVGRREWRNVSSEMVIGPNYNGNKEADEERYISRTLGITFVYPHTWTQSSKGAKIVLFNEDKTVQLKIDASKVTDDSVTLKDTLETKYPEGLEDVSVVEKKGNQLAAVYAAHDNKRVAVKQVGNY